MEHAGSVAGWMHQVAGQMRSISLPILVLALALHTCEMLLNALAWRNILRRTYPRSDVAYRVVLGGYGGGVALNSLLPAQAGEPHVVALESQCSPQGLTYRPFVVDNEDLHAAIVRDGSMKGLRSA